MEDLTGKTLGKYQITGPLGEGGMAAVYKAFQADMERYVALKILPRHLASDPRFIQRFHQEAKIIARLQHPHILPVYDFGEAEGYTYLVMPFIESGTLADRQIHQPLPLAEIRKIITQVGEALDYAHSQGVIHRDVKPSNILIDEWGQCLLTDFGIGKILAASNQITRTGEMVGTPAYISPEQGLGSEIDGRSDLYSLGVICYELATGRPPYNAETPMAIVIKHIYDPLPPPRQVNPALPEKVEGVILKALTKDREQRYATAGEMVQAIKAAIPGTTKEPAEPSAAQPTPGQPATPPSYAPPISHAPPAAAGGSRRKKRNRPWLWLAGGGLLFAGLMLIIGLAALGIRLISGAFPAGSGNAAESAQPDSASIVATVFPEPSAYVYAAEGLELTAPARIWSQNPELADQFQGEVIADPQGIFGQAARLFVQGYGHGDQAAWFTISVQVPAQADIISVPVATALNGSVTETDSEAGLEITVRNAAGQKSRTYAAYLMETRLGFAYVYAFADVSPFRGQPVELTITLQQPDVCAGAQCTYNADFYFGDLYFGQMADICTRQFDNTLKLYDYYSDPTPQVVNACEDPQPYYFVDLHEGPHNAYGRGQSAFEVPFALPEKAEIIEFRLYYGSAAESLEINNHSFAPEEIHAAFPVRAGIYLNIAEPARYSLFNNNPGLAKNTFNWGNNQVKMSIITAETWEERPFDLFLRFRVPTE